MNRRVIIIGSILFVLFVAAFVISYIPKARLAANQLRSQNNLRELALFAAHHSKPEKTNTTTKYPTEIPAGTIPLPNVPPEQRLSWVVPVLPLLDQKRQNTAELYAQIDQAAPWLAERNQQAGKTRLVVLLCPQNTPEVPPDAPAVTCYVGIGGLGVDAASLPVGSPKAGAFRYDSPTPFERVTDGLSQTFLFAETRNELGPWLRGGVATVRGLNDAPDAPPLVGGQFGGYFPSGANFAFCDGSVRIFTPKTAPQVLFSFATIAGKGTDPVPLE